MKSVRDEGAFSEGFPSYTVYQCERLIPVAKILLGLSVAYLVGFLLIDYFKYPQQIHVIAGFRLLAAAPLVVLLWLFKKPSFYPYLPAYILALGLLSFSFFLALNLSIPEKKHVVVLVPVFYMLVIIALAPLFKWTYLVVTFAVGFLVYYWAGFFYIKDNQYISLVFPHMTAIVLFSLITVLKIRQSAKEYYGLAQQMHWRTLHDELTAVYNRRGIFDWVRQRNIFAGKTFEAVSLAMLDLDHFKQINDTLGHDVGDAVIKQSAQLIQQNLGENSAVARFGGEEFLLVLQEGSDTANLQQVKHILELFRRHNFGQDLDQQLKATVSIGFVNHRGTRTFEQSLKLADDRMYQAKKSGRDRLVDGR